MAEYFAVPMSHLKPYSFLLLGNVLFNSCTGSFSLWDQKSWVVSAEPMESDFFICCSDVTFEAIFLLVTGQCTLWWLYGIKKSLMVFGEPMKC